MRAFLKRYRELIIVGTLLVFPIAVWLTHAKHGRDLSALDRIVLTATAPIERAVNGVVFAIIDTVEDFTNRQEVHAENLELRRRVIRLEGEVAALGEVRMENERLRQTLGFVESAPAPLLPARVVGEGVSHNLIALKIDKGLADGLKPNMAVLSHQGVVGRVQSVAHTSASVVLVADESASVPIRVQRSRARGTVVGRGPGEDFALIRMQRTDDIKEGDLLVTSGTDGIFPKGLPVGRVASVERPHHGMFLSARVTPAVDLSCPDSLHEELFVVTSLPGSDESQEANLVQEPRP